MDLPTTDEKGIEEPPRRRRKRLAKSCAFPVRLFPAKLFFFVLEVFVKVAKGKLGDYHAL